MDSLTQIVLGAAVGEAVLGKKVGNKALLWGAVAGTIPDLDVVYIWLKGGGSIDEIVLHRGISHSIVFAFAMAPILGWLVNWLYRKKPEADFKGWTWLFFWSIFTHPMLDSLTTYGTQLFLPFSDFRVSIASVFVVDFFYTVPFLISVIAVSFIKRSSGWRKKVNYFGLGLSTTYLLAGLINKYSATRIFQNDLENEPQNELVFVGTTPLNILLWYGVAESDSSFQIGYYSLFDDDSEIEWIPFNKNHHLLDEIENEYGVNRLKWFSDNLFIVTREDETTLNFYTLKFGRSKFESAEPDGSFAFYMRIHQSGQTGELEYETVHDTDVNDLGPQIKKLVKRITGDNTVVL